MKVGVLCGGQLGMMLGLAGRPLGHSFRFLDPTPEACAKSAGELVTGSISDNETLRRFAEGLDVVTCEFENVPAETLDFLSSLVKVRPSSAIFAVAQDRQLEKSLLRDLRIPTPQFRAVDSLDELKAAASEIGLPSVLKTRRLGYDGKGQAVLHSRDDIEKGWEKIGKKPAILEELVPFRRELSVIVTRDEKGSSVFYPLVQNTHREGVLRLSEAPASDSSKLQDSAWDYAKRIVDHFGYVGTLALELFDRDGLLLANEMAPRVHNSGHWTIEGAETSQFENHLRAVCGMGLGSTEARGFSFMINLIGDIPDVEQVRQVPGAHVHVYGKELRPGRKVGHITVVGVSRREASEGCRAVMQVVK